MTSNASINESIQFKQDREISWLKFNQRVLEEADDASIPILERLKFVSIYSTNLDEFFMIRVGSLYDKSIYAPESVDNKSGQTPKEQLKNIYKMVHGLNQEYNESFKSVEMGLRSKSITSVDINGLRSSEIKFVKQTFYDTIYPILSPQIVDSHHPFPHLNNKSIYIACLLKYKDKTILGIVPVPEKLPPLIFLPDQTHRYIHKEKVILEFVQDIFESYQVVEKTCICVTRNADINPDDDTFENTADFRNTMKKLLHIRKRLSVVRLETCNEMSEYFTEYLCGKLGISGNQIFVIAAPMNMSYVYELIDKVAQTTNHGLLYPPFEPVNPMPVLKTGMLNLASKQALFFHYPYVSMKPFLQLIKQAANNPNVISIKITIYRLAMRATLVDYLCSAAENGIEVTVFIELRARFDEQNNIDWSQKLEDSGCTIIYGFEEYKVHSKVCLITYKDKGEIRFITQIGTGNYNEKTAELYTDLSLITHNQEIGMDAKEFFMNLSIGNLEGQYKHLMVAPFSLKPRLLNLIDEEINKGIQGKILFKLNSITDIDIINKLAEASNAGVSITMIVRGICCILPRVQGMTENIKIISIVGRFLEHSRIFSFGSGDSQKLYISSADMMTRNLNRRIEVACPILDIEIKREINEILETTLYDNVKARIIDSQGNYNRIANSRISINSQEIFIDQAIQKKYKSVYAKNSLFFKIKDYFKEYYSKEGN